ncbi:MAG TPA: DNA alkylation repair protein [Methylomirabilota bacterium]|nr:DNA alkylation repair protein [Methylomirabilota bacterium]
MTTTGPKAALADLDRRLKRVGNAKRAKWDEAYLKSDLVFYGVTLPELHRVVRAYVREHPELDRRALRELALGAFKTKKHDLRSAAIGIVDRKRALLEDRDLPWLLDLVDASNTWAHVDWLAVGVIGEVYARYPASLRWLPLWARQKNFWIRRTALLAQHDELKRGKGDWVLCTRLADTMLNEEEFFIRKAIGWVLRETSKKRPKLVYDYLRPRRERASGLTLREGATYLSATQRKALGLGPRA